MVIWCFLDTLVCGWHLKHCFSTETKTVDIWNTLFLRKQRRLIFGTLFFYGNKDGWYLEHCFSMETKTVDIWNTVFLRKQRRLISETRFSYGNKDGWYLKRCISTKTKTIDIWNTVFLWKQRRLIFGTLFPRKQRKTGLILQNKKCVLICKDFKLVVPKSFTWIVTRIH